VPAAIRAEPEAVTVAPFAVGLSPVRDQDLGQAQVESRSQGILEESSLDTIGSQQRFALELALPLPRLLVRSDAQVFLPARR
jgi:hypothetical protein